MCVGGAGGAGGAGGVFFALLLMRLWLFLPFNTMPFMASIFYILYYSIYIKE
jgi:hypothetical protein